MAEGVFSAALGQSPEEAWRALVGSFERFRSLAYIRHNMRRLEHLASLGLDLSGKRVLDLGAGIGDHAAFYIDRGCTVVSVEPRQENIDMLVASYRSSGYRPPIALTAMRLAAEEIGRVAGSFDIVHCYGLLYHLADPAPVMRAAAEKCTGLMLVETCVSAGAGESLNPVDEPAADATQAVGGRGCRPTRAWVRARLRESFPFVYLPRAQPAHEEFPGDWTAADSDPQRLKRAVFVASRQPLALSTLRDDLPDRQERA
ncbi:MAG: methyltransferase domain-containing protein [Alphaproteobacteria bacterium]|nr:methyltransferase domain-containing protein [Alphaproteobacteria bacterium]